MKNIISVGYDIPGHSDLFFPYRSNKSLLDSDIIVFCPEIEGYDIEDHPNTYFQGKLLYSLNGSFNLREDTSRWKRELQIALQAGKNIFLILYRLDKFFLTDQRSYSGTGRNARPSVNVSESHNYSFLPLLVTLSASSGKEIKYLGDSLFLPFWNEFKEAFEYQNYIESDVSTKLMITKTGNKTVAGVIRQGKGNFVLLPYIIQGKDFTKYDKQKDKTFWTEKGIVFGNKLLQSILTIDKGLSEDSEVTPSPGWLTKEIYISNRERELQNSVVDINGKIDALVRSKSDLLNEIDEEQYLKRLLYETGKPLENAIIKALEILGYKAENVVEGDLELDQVIISPEKDRFIGEAEGKDNSQISIDKLRQLNTNLQEDLQREEVKEIATGILFGNAFRLTDPKERNIQFTEKCISTANKTNIILVETNSLYKVCHYVQSSGDVKFARKCRDVIKKSIGSIVNFPDIPDSKQDSSIPVKVEN